jgi:hypothetical protein
MENTPTHGRLTSAARHSVLWNCWNNNLQICGGIVKEFFLNDHIKINHPLAERISVQNSSRHHAGENTSEVAFFANKKFQTKIVKEFADYADGVEGDTLVYSWVPNKIVESFLDKYRVST